MDKGTATDLTHGMMGKTAHVHLSTLQLMCMNLDHKPFEMERDELLQTLADCKDMQEMMGILRTKVAYHDTITQLEQITHDQLVQRGLEPALPAAALAEEVPQT